MDAILRLWRELRRGTLIERPPAWLYRAIYRLAMDQHHWRQRLSCCFPGLRQHAGITPGRRDPIA